MPKIFPLLLLPLISPFTILDQRIPTKAKKVPFPKDVTSLSSVTDKEYHRWRINQEEHSGSFVTDGFLVEYFTPEFVAATTSREAKDKLLDETDKEKKWKENKASFLREGEITFRGYIYFKTNYYHLGDLDGDWAFYLSIDEGKRLKPIEIKMNKSFQLSLSDHEWDRNFIVRFANKTEDGKPLITPETKSVALVVAGAPKQAQARYEFERKRK